jgi:hypothetical protein
VKKRPPASEQNLLEELRQLTEKTRKLREELRGMVSTPKSRDLTRSLVHTHNWPKERRVDDSPTADDRRRKKR